VFVLHQTLINPIFALFLHPRRSSSSNGSHKRPVRSLFLCTIPPHHHQCRSRFGASEKILIFLLFSRLVSALDDDCFVMVLAFYGCIGGPTYITAQVWVQIIRQARCTVADDDNEKFINFLRFALSRLKGSKKQHRGLGMSFLSSAPGSSQSVDEFSSRREPDADFHSLALTVVTSSPSPPPPALLLPPGLGGVRLRALLLCFFGRFSFNAFFGWEKPEKKKGENVFGAENFRLVFHHSHACIYVFSLCFRPFIKTARNFVSVFCSSHSLALFLPFLLLALVLCALPIHFPSLPSLRSFILSVFFRRSFQTFKFC
jgi:hypothetical protein